MIALFAWVANGKNPPLDRLGDRCLGTFGYRPISFDQGVEAPQLILFGPFGE